MHKKSLIGLLAAVLAAATIVLAAPAGAIANACTVSMWPNLPGGQSNLKQNCTETTATGTVGGHGLGALGQETSLEDFPQAIWHFGAARTALNGAAASPVGVAATATTPARTCLTLAASAHVSAADVNHGISYPALPANIPARTFISAVGTGPCGVGKVAIDANLAAGKVLANAALLIENSDGRSVTDGSTTNAGATVCSVSANFRAADMAGQPLSSRVLSGTGIPYNDHITAIVAIGVLPCGPGQTGATLAAPATATATAQALTIGADSRPVTALVGTTTTREVHDVRVNAANQLCSATANFGFTDIQLPVLTAAGGNIGVAGAAVWITGVGVGAGACAGMTTATLSGNDATAVGTTGVVQVIGQPNAAAPKNGDVMSSLGAEIVLNPGVVTGQPACTQHQPQGFSEVGSWTNPGSITQGTDALSFDNPNDPYINQPIIASVDYPTSVVTFSGYVEQVKASLAGESNFALAHYDVKFPALPAGFAACPAPDVSGLAASFNYMATTQSISKQATGTGTPGTGIVRALNNSSVAVTHSAFVHLANGTVNPAGSACTTPGPPVAADISVTAGAINHQCLLTP